jgi:hypothetical protein
MIINNAFEEERNRREGAGVAMSLYPFVPS